MPVRVSRVSRTAAILIILIGVFTLAAGVFAPAAEDMVAGMAFVVLGVFLYVLLYRFTRKVEREIDEEERG